jgi:hypothetical protein
MDLKGVEKERMGAFKRRAETQQRILNESQKK